LQVQYDKKSFFIKLIDFQSGDASTVVNTLFAIIIYNILILKFSDFYSNPLDW